MSRTSEGTLLAGRYRLDEWLAAGGMGTVWRAYDTRLDRPVAVKEVLLPPGLDDDEQEALRRRTMREARSAARLRHPAIVTIFDVVEHDGQPWIVMELVPAPSLDKIIRERGGLPPAEAAAIGLRILDALVTAHAAGVQHRDIKPANVLVGDNGRVVLTDFGIARHVGDETLTTAGLLVGSPDYLSPERARGHDSPGLAADLWSLGATLYTAVEGKPPFARNGPLPTLAAVVMDEPAPPRRAGALRPVIDALLVKNPAHRLDADRTRAMLQRALRTPGAPPVGPPPGPYAGAPPARTVVLPAFTPPAPGPENGAVRGPEDGGSAVGVAAAGAADTTVTDAPVVRPGAPDVPPAPTPPAQTPPAQTTPVEQPAAQALAAASPAGAAPPAEQADAQTRAAEQTATEAPDARTPVAEPPAHEAPAREVPVADGSPESAETPTDKGGASAVGRAAAMGAAGVAAAAAGAPAGQDAAARPAERPSGSGATAARGTERAATAPDGTTAAPARGAGAGTATDAPPAAGADTTAANTTAADATAADATAAGRTAADATAAAPTTADPDPSPTAAPPRPPAGTTPTARGTAVAPPRAGAATTPGTTTRPPTTRLPSPPGPTPTRRRRRRAGLVAGVIALLGVLAAVLVPLATGDDPTDRQASPAPSGGPSAGGGSPGAGGTPTDRAGASTAASPTAAATTATAAPTTPAATRTSSTATPGTAIPAGFTRYTDPRTGFSLAVPQGWPAVVNSVRIDFKDPRSGRFLRIDTTSSPQDDPYQNWLDSERAIKRRAPDYRRIQLRRVSYRGWETADWEFLAFGNHVLNRNIRVSDRRAHAIYWSTPASQWDSASSKQVFEVAARTFQPAP